MRRIMNKMLLKNRPIEKQMYTQINMKANLKYVKMDIILEIIRFRFKNYLNYTIH